MCELIFLTSALKKIDHTSKGFIYVCLGYGFCKVGGGGCVTLLFPIFFFAFKMHVTLLLILGFMISIYFVAGLSIVSALV